jgi:hypothetical protein
MTKCCIKHKIFYCSEPWRKGERREERGERREERGERREERGERREERGERSYNY